MVRKAVSIGTALRASMPCAFAQQPLTFDVASVKPSPQNCSPDALCPALIIRQPGGPAWLSSDCFDINAKADSLPADPRQLTDEQQKTGLERTRERLRNLLADLFQLTIGHETKEQQVYALAVAKGGPKLEQSKEKRDGMRMGRGMLSAESVAPAMLASTLSQQLGRPVIDKTGLTGKYDFDLKWTPGPAPAGAGPFGPPPPGIKEPPPPDPNGPTIFTALTEQLGLRLESEKDPVELLIIDRVEKPSEN